MKIIWGVLAAILTTLTGIAILGDLVSEEIRGRLDRLPYALIRLAAHRLPLDVREDLAEEWTAELHEILRGAEALPVTRLYRGIRYSLGLLRTAPSIGYDISASTAIPRAAGKASDIRHRLDRLPDRAIMTLGTVVEVVAVGLGAVAINGIITGPTATAAIVISAIAAAVGGAAGALTLSRAWRRRSGQQKLTP